MADKPKTKWGEYNGQLYYARIFKDNMDDSDYHDKTQGQFNVVFVPDEDESLSDMLSKGFPETSMGNKMIKPIDAAEGTIRKFYATSLSENAIHGSDSDENAKIESNFHFSSEEIY